MHTRTVSRAALLALFVAACSESPAPMELDPQFDFANGPSDLANVDRSQDNTQLLGFYDPESDLTVYVAAYSPICGTPDTGFHTTTQDAGGMQGAVNRLEKGRMFISLFQGPSGECGTPIGEGVGQLMFADNDFWSTGTRTNRVGWRINAKLELVHGGTASLVAVFKFLKREGQTVRETSFIRLTR